MTWYEFLLFVHISASVVWIGVGFLLIVLAIRADRTGDEATRRLLALARIDYVTLFLVIADMAIKPTGDDVGLLIAMAAIFAAGLAWAIGVAQSVTVPEGAAASG